MKSYLKVVIGAIFLGGILAFFFYKDIKTDVIAITDEKGKVYIFQVGVFKSLENANNYRKDFSSGDIYQDEDVYRVITAVTISNKEKLETFYKKKEINYYIKELYVDNDIYEKIIEYDSVITNTSNEEVINKINKSSVELFLSVKP